MAPMNCVPDIEVCALRELSCAPKTEVRALEIEVRALQKVPCALKIEVHARPINCVPDG